MKPKALSLIAAVLLGIAAVPAHAGYIVKATTATEATAATSNACTDMNAVATTTATADYNATVTAAKEEFKNLSRTERKTRVNAVKDQIRTWKAAGHHGDVNMLLYVILAILLPPLAVGLYDNGLSTRFWIDLILTLLFYLPGLIYALIVILG